MSTSRWPRRAAALALGLLLAPCVGEVGARVYPPDAGAALLYNAPAGTPPDMFRYDSAGRLVPNPGFDGHYEWLDHSVSVRFDSRGLRGPETLPPAPRWLSVGDSFVLARQVDEADTFMALASPGLGANLINAGMDGYATWDYLARYLALDPVVEAEAVLVTLFVGNDPAQDDGPSAIPRGGDPFARVPLAPHADTADNAFALFRIAHESPTPTEAFLFRHSALFAWWRVFDALAARDPLDQQRQARFRQELLPFSEEGASKVQRLAGATGNALDAFKRLASARGDRLLVAVAPASFALDAASTSATLHTFGLDASRPAPTSLHDAIVARARDQRIDTCDLRPALVAARQGGEEPYFRFEGHWNQAGHRAVAEALVRCFAGSTGATGW